jgi:multidrug efflux pump subunit AcrA (membrane-fusion protein)
MKLQKLIITITVIILIAILGITAYILIEPDFSKPKENLNSNVALQTVSSGDMENSINKNGTIAASNSLVVRTPIDCVVSEFIFKNNSLVKVNDLLATLDVEALRHSRLVKRELLQQNITANTGNSVDSNDLRADIVVLNHLIDDPYIKSPADGYIDGITENDSVGFSLPRDMKLLNFYPQDNYIINITVSEDDVTKLRLDQTATITLANSGEQSGKVSKIDYIGNADGFEVQIKFDSLENTETSTVFIGQSGSVSIIIEKKEQVLKVPLQSLYTDSQGHYVMLFLGDDDVSTYQQDAVPSEKRYVQTGMISELYAEIISGVEIGDRVVIISASNEQTANGESGKSVVKGLTGGTK